MKCKTCGLEYQNRKDMMRHQHQSHPEHFVVFRQYQFTHPKKEASMPEPKATTTPESTPESQTKPQPKPQESQPTSKPEESQDKPASKPEEPKATTPATSQEDKKKVGDSGQSSTNSSTNPSSEQITAANDFTPSIEPLKPSTPPQEMEFEEEDVKDAYGAVLETAYVMLKDQEIEITPTLEKRVQKRGHQLYRIMKKYGLSLSYLDLVFCGLGVAGDIASINQGLKFKKLEDKTEPAKPEPIMPKSEEFLKLQSRVKI